MIVGERGAAYPLPRSCAAAHCPPSAACPLPQVAIADMIFDVLKVAWGKFEASGK